MKKITRLIVLYMAFFVIQYANAADVNVENSPLGFWKTIDDISGKPRAVIHITATSYNTLNGTIVKSFPGQGESTNDVCSACKGERHNKRILGMTILENLKQNKHNKKEWSGGQILDPKSGKMYHCTLQVADNGKRLIVRGYIGLPLFGRTQTWIRVSNP